MKDKMRNIYKKEIIQMDRFERANLLTSLSGIKAASLVGTVSNQNISNVAIFSSIIHLGSNPALVGLLIRPQTKKMSDTYINIKSNNSFTINHVNENIIKKSHYTSAKTDSNTSEFDDVGLTEEYIDNFLSPFVKESDIGFGLLYNEEILLSNNCKLIIGEIDNIKLNKNIKSESGIIDLANSNSIGVDGIGTYYKLNKSERHEYIGRTSLPNKI
tara:strand:- start:515 stop:1159 length:645 start_codon:yes stop_codon:yes gene_type:complete